MNISRAARIAAVLVAGAVLAVPAAAGAVEIPGLPPGTIPDGTLPPELEAVIDDAVADTLTSLVGLDLTGVAQNSVTPGHASAAAVDIPGVVTVGKTDTTKTSSNVTVLSAGGQDLLSRSGSTTGGTWTGPLAPAGDVVDAVNNALCPTGVADKTQTCVVVLYSRATDTTNGRGHTAKFKAAKVQLAGTPEGIEILPADAATTVTPIGTKSFCTDVATAFIATGSGTVALVSLIGLGNAISFSVFKAC